MVLRDREMRQTFEYNPADMVRGFFPAVSTLADDHDFRKDAQRLADPDSYCRVVDAISGCRKLLESEPSFIEFDDSLPLAVLGDLHCDINTLRMLVEHYIPTCRVAILGDLVDGGRSFDPRVRNLEMYAAFSALKLKAPDRLFLFKGNHDCMTGFDDLQDLTEMFGLNFHEDREDPLYAVMVNELRAFTRAIPNMGATRDVLLVHGMVPPVDDLEMLKAVSRVEFSVDDPMTRFMCWTDVCTNESKFSLSDVAVNDSRRGFYMVGREYVEKVLDMAGRRVIVRGHQPDAVGYSFDGKVLTLMSSRGEHHMCAGGRRVGVYVAGIVPGRDIRSAHDLIVYPVYDSPALRDVLVRHE